MKIIFLVTLMASMVIVPILIIAMLPFAIMGSLAIKITTLLTDWLSYLSDNLQE